MPKEQIGEIKEKLAEFVPVMEGLSRARNPFELRYFVIGKHDDRVQQYKQAVVEMDSKYKAIVEAQHERKVRALEIEKLELKLVRHDEPLTREEEIANEEVYLAIEKLLREDKAAQVAMTGAFKEVMDFITIIENEYSDLVEKTEEELLECEVDYWKARFIKQCHIDLMVAGRLGEGNRSTMAMLPKSVQEEILEGALMRTEETKLLESSVAKKTLIRLAESYPHKTAFIAPPDYTPLKLRKDAPDGYPENKIVNIDRAEIMIATLHRPGDRVWLTENFWIPTGKNNIKHWLECPNGESIGEYRNRIIKDALSLGCTHIFFVDDDLIVPQDALLKLYAHDLDIVGGWYVKKQPVLESATMITTPGSQSMRPVPLDATGLVDVDWALTGGCTLVKMDAFKRIPYPQYLTTPQGTEDCYFTARAREVGIKSWLDTNIKCEHVDKGNGDAYGFDGVAKGKYERFLQDLRSA